MGPSSGSVEARVSRAFEFRKQSEKSFRNLELNTDNPPSNHHKSMESTGGRMHVTFRGSGRDSFRESAQGGAQPAGTQAAGKRRTRTILALTAAGALLFAACSSDKLASSTSNEDRFANASDTVAGVVSGGAERESSPAAVGLAPDQAANQVADDVVATTTPADGSGTGGSAAQPTPDALANRKIIRTAQVTLQVTNVPDASTKLRNAVASAGGFVGAEEAVYGNRDQVTLTFRIPVGQFDAMINRLSKFGSVLSTNIASQEVTGQYRDLVSRLRSKKISAERLRQLITQATKPADILLIEHELSDREAEIESMQGQLNVLGDQTALSTITITVVSEGNSTVVAPIPTREPSFARAWRASLRTLGDIAQALAAATGAMLPFVPFLGAALAAAFWFSRRRAARRQATNVSSTEGSSTAGSSTEGSSTVANDAPPIDDGGTAAGSPSAETVDPTPS